MFDVSNEHLWEAEFARPSTEHMRKYNSLEAKVDCFGSSHTFDSATLFFNFINRMEKVIEESNSPVIYRGMSEASHRLYSKAQRAFHVNNPTGNSKQYHETIAKMLDDSRVAYNGLLTKYFRAFGAKDYDAAILSFLQHYGAPTPFLDWTTDFYIALFFGISALSHDQIELEYETPGYDIQNYISIYGINLNQIKVYLKEFRPLNVRSLKSASYEKLSKKKLAFITEGFVSEKPRFFLANNFNILQQHGAFIFNSDPFLPLEEVIRKLSTRFYLVGTGLRNEPNTYRSPIMCININKCIVKHIKEELDERGITASNIFPSPQDIISNVVPSLLRF